MFQCVVDHDGQTTLSDVMMDKRSCVEYLTLYVVLCIAYSAAK